MNFLAGFGSGSTWTAQPGPPPKTTTMHHPRRQRPNSHNAFFRRTRLRRLRPGPLGGGRGLKVREALRGETYDPKGATATNRG